MAVVNTTSLLILDNNVDLYKFASVNAAVVYNARHFSAARFFSDDPKYCALIFANGRVVITGPRSQNLAEAACKHLLTILEWYLEKSFSVRTFSLRNMVLSYDVGRTIDLVEFYNNNKLYCSYEVELFPGLIYRSQVPSVTFTLFASGKVNVTGIKDFADKEKVIAMLEGWFSSAPKLRASV